MPFAINDGVRIHYEIDGVDGPPLVLQHGLMSSGVDWREAGYLEAFRDRFQLILVDGRGHGLSDKPHDPEAYRVSIRARDVTAVLDDLGVEAASFWGVSMGAAIGYGLIWRAPERIDRMVIGAGQMYEKSPASPLPDLLANGVEATVAFLDEARLKQGAQPMSGPQRARFLNNDMDAILAAFCFPWETAPISQALRSFNRPFLLYCGDQDWGYDLTKRVVADAPMVEFVTLEGIDHPGSWSRSDLVIPIVKDFLLRQET